MEKLKSIYISSYSAVVTIVVIVVVTVATELSVSFKNWLASFTGHHWVTKSWLSVITFALLLVVLHFSIKNVDAIKTKRAIMALEIMAVLGFIVLLGFFTYEFISH